MESQSSGILLTRSTTSSWADAHKLNHRVNLHHTCTDLTHARKLGLQTKDLMVAALDAPQLPDTSSDSNDATASIVIKICIMYIMMRMNWRTLTRGPRVLQTGGLLA